MSYTDDSRDLPNGGGRNRRGYPADYQARRDKAGGQEFQPPTPIDPDPDPLPDVRPPHVAANPANTAGPGIPQPRQSHPKYITDPAGVAQGGHSPQAANPGAQSMPSLGPRPYTPPPENPNQTSVPSPSRPVANQHIPPASHPSQTQQRPSQAPIQPRQAHPQPQVRQPQHRPAEPPAQRPAEPKPRQPERTQRPAEAQPPAQSAREVSMGIRLPETAKKSPVATPTEGPQVERKTINLIDPEPGESANPVSVVVGETVEKPAVSKPEESTAVSKSPPAQRKPEPVPERRNLDFVSGSEERSSPVSGELLLHTEGLVKIYDGRTVVNGVNINVKKGEIVGLLGPNGAGKTTSFYMIVGLVPPNGGVVNFDGKDVTRLPMFKRARLGMGYLPQEESIFRKLTVEENIMAVMQTMNYSRKEKKARCDELLERFSITHIRKNVAMTCSGGEKRRVTIARSLVPDPSLIMLDEPFSGVDPIAVNEIQSIVEDLRKAGLAILITDHNARQTLELVDRAYLIYEGRVLREGPKDFLINDPVSRELYLGDRFTM